MRTENLLDRPFELDPARREDDEVVTHALALGDDVRREHDGEPILGDGPHQRLQELASREWVERGHRLVEHEQLGPLGKGERQRDLRLLASGKTADLLAERNAELARAVARARSSSQRGFSFRPSFSISASLKPR